MTRAQSGLAEDRLTTLLRLRGALPVHVPLTSTLPPEDPRPLLEAAARLPTDYDWLVVTSARAVEPLVRALGRAGLPVDRVRASAVRICAVGPATARSLSDAGLPPHLIPERFEARGIVSALAAEVEPGKDGRILMPRAQEGRDLIPRALAWHGFRTDVVAAYRTVSDMPGSVYLADLVSEERIDALTFTAGSAAISFAEGWADRGPLPGQVGVIVLGPTTAEVTVQRGLRIDRVADPHTLEGLVDAVEDWAKSRTDAA